MVTRSAVNQIPQQQKTLAQQGVSFLSQIAPDFAAWFAFNAFLTPKRRPYSANARRILVESIKSVVQDEDREFVVYRWGHGPTVLLVHGWEGNAASMRAFIPVLLEKGFQVVAFDAPAHGDSKGKQTNLVEMASAVRRLITLYGPIHSVIAHSIGGLATIMAVENLPEGQVGRIVLNGSPSEIENVWYNYAQSLGLSDSTLQAMYRRLERKVGYSIEHFSAKRVVPSINIPGLVIHDVHDQVIPFTEAETIIAHWKTASLLTTRKLDHRGGLADPTVIEKVMSFLTDQK